MNNPSPADAKKVIGAIVLFFLIVIILISSFANRKSVREIDPERAFLMSHYFVMQNLKSPSTADFPLYDYRAINLGGNQWSVTSYVDAQNSFGATIRTNYRVFITFQGGEWNDILAWRLNEISIE